MEKEEKIFLSMVRDKKAICLNRNILQTTGFLDTHQQYLVLNEFKDSSFALFGGYDEAERKILYFLPDYIDDVPKDKILILKASFSKDAKLSHRDILGSILGLGIKRENVGDIIMADTFAQIFIKEEIGDFILAEYNKAGRQHLSLEFISEDELVFPQNSFDYKTETVSSLRLDCIVSAIFNISRNEAVKLIDAKRVFVNDSLITKCDKLLSEGDKIKVTKMGKAYLEKVGGTSRKGRIFIDIKKHI